ncbi:hypothetical protein FJW08_07300 [Mesorhizobium sp. B3-2-1]|uniref:PIN-like domain-containing protein n=1 Tax=Mesorhizobium sp. B3-2-1 TaxID=2589891 RepID=UPI001127BBD7|nr:PIN-like domain-containing protein [Mesorhizobium sp. B3-2-1]TPI32974.1 hypothetical protein FJW08_07300 [Mesorhizobium sp. B3-2-1]
MLNWRKRQATSGFNRSCEMSSDAIVSRVLALVNREVEFDALGALIFSLRPEQSTVPLEETAIAFDTNVLLRLSNHARGADIVDFLRTSHDGPLILPGQVIQEFWNNQFQAVDSLSSSIRKKFEALKSEISKVDESFGSFSDRFAALLDDFSGSFGYIYDEATFRRVHTLLDVMKAKALVPYAPRAVFSRSAALRKVTGTPPGFKDERDGDFFVWVDLLVGLQRAAVGGSQFKRVVLISHDRKIDWSREGTPHPILIAEMRALTGASFEIWSIDKLAKELLD